MTKLGSLKYVITQAWNTKEVFCSFLCWDINLVVDLITHICDVEVQNKGGPVVVGMF